MFIDMDEKYPVNSSTLYSAFLRRSVDALQAIEAEIRREKAEALGRAGRTTGRCLECAGERAGVVR